MTKIAVTVSSKEELLQYNQIDNVGRYLIGSNDFGIRLNKTYSLEEIEEFSNVAHSAGKEVYIVVNRIFHERELKKLEKYLERLVLKDIDGVVFGDFAVKGILDRLDKEIKTIYSTDTIITNNYFTEFAKDSEINEIELAREITLEEILDINENKKVPISILVQGPIAMYHSSRELLKNYESHLEEKNNFKFRREGKRLYLFDEERNRYYYLHENQHGTHILSNEYLTGIKYILDLLEAEIDYLVIDDFTYSEAEILEVVRIYDELLSSYTDDTLDNKIIKEYMKKLKGINPEREYTSGFLNKKTMY